VHGLEIVEVSIRRNAGRPEGAPAVLHAGVVSERTIAGGGIRSRVASVSIGKALPKGISAGAGTCHSAVRRPRAPDVGNGHARVIQLLLITAEFSIAGEYWILVVVPSGEEQRAKIAADAGRRIDVEHGAVAVGRGTDVNVAFNPVVGFPRDD